ncbi:chemotaxis protein CheX [Sporomusa sp.]|uniref:chemotaxis protein CheX n=1 Tax=Sporomusa sp. TaxID=2078658 RepID=UPI002BB79C14|nr:chemotaxis protein CheX [Sporomusa sp.]HWR44839.1 chemotaxis protein CheX [Sporomusa sp.]
MKAEYVNPFFQALKEVFKLMLDLEITKNTLNAKKDLVSENEVTVAIKLTGDISGSVLFSFPESTTLEIVKIMSGMELHKLDSFVTSALGEVSNIISGNAVTYLSQANYHCDILPPQIVIRESSSSALGTEQTLTIPLHTSIGGMRLNFAIDENK